MYSNPPHLASIFYNGENSETNLQRRLILEYDDFELVSEQIQRLVVGTVWQSGFSGRACVCVYAHACVCLCVCAYVCIRYVCVFVCVCVFE